MKHPADLGIARRAADGDLGAFAVLVREHEVPLRRLMRRLAGDEGDDLAQDALLLAWRRIGQFRGDAAFGSWLTRIAIRRFLDARRSRRTPLPTIPDAAPGLPLDEGLALRQALGSLPPAERVAAVLVFGEGHSHAEAADLLAIPLGTLKSQVARARRRLLPLLDGDPS